MYFSQYGKGQVLLQINFIFISPKAFLTELHSASFTLSHSSPFTSRFPLTAARSQALTGTLIYETAVTNPSLWISVIRKGGCLNYKSLRDLCPHCRRRRAHKTEAVLLLRYKSVFSFDRFDAASHTQTSSRPRGRADLFCSVASAVAGDVSCSIFLETWGLIHLPEIGSPVSGIFWWSVGWGLYCGGGPCLWNDRETRR